MIIDDEGHWVTADAFKSAEILVFTPKQNFQAEKDLLDAIKADIYNYSGHLSVAQVMGVLRIAEQEIYGEQL